MPHRTTRNTLHDESGATLIFLVFAMVVLIGGVALAVDTGMLLTARTESQRAADAAALAGAGELAVFPGDSARAHGTAKGWVGLNPVRGAGSSVLDSDVSVDPDANTVQVTVHNTASRGNAVPTVFARMLGWNQVDVVTTATAEATSATSALCPLPLALPDRWIDDGDGEWDPPADVYEPWPNQGHTGFGDDDVGLRIQVKTQPSSGSGGPQGCSTATGFDPCAEHPGWYCWWVDERGPNGNNILGPRIYPGCEDPNTFSSIDDEIWSGPGNRQSLVTDEFKDLVDSDPTVSWDESQGCVARDGQCTTDSRRIRSLPLVRPDRVTGAGANLSAPIHGFTGVFVEKVSCSPTMPHGGGPPGRWNVYMRLMGHTGFAPGPSTGPNGPLSKAIRLIR